MDNLYKQITAQLHYNRSRNILCKESKADFAFAPATINFIKSNHIAIQQLEAAKKEQLLHFITEKVLDTFYEVNQYYYFNKEHQLKLKELYLELWQQLENPTAIWDDKQLAAIAKQHYQNLQHWLKTSNSFAEAIYANNAPDINQEVTCAQYSAHHQIHLLNINLNQLKEPILDIGCGQEAYLVKYLRSLGLEAYGIDRMVGTSKYLTKADWFDYKFAQNYWGTITSNLGFSNHFRHHHLRNDGDFISYAKKYMEILSSLKTGCAFYYAPDLPFIEQYLEADKFKVTRKNIIHTTHNTAKIERVR